MSCSSAVEKLDDNLCRLTLKNRGEARGYRNSMTFALSIPWIAVKSYDETLGRGVCLMDRRAPYFRFALTAAAVLGLSGCNVTDFAINPEGQKELNKRKSK